MVGYRLFPGASVVLPPGQRPYPRRWAGYWTCPWLSRHWARRERDDRSARATGSQSHQWPSDAPNAGCRSHSLILYWPGRRLCRVIAARYRQCLGFGTCRHQAGCRQYEKEAPAVPAGHLGCGRECHRRRLTGQESDRGRQRRLIQ